MNEGTRPINFQGNEYFDDRVFVLDIARALPSSPPNPNDKPWCLVTRRNVRGYPPTRADDFDTWEAAAEYVRRIEPETPLISHDGKSPNPAPTYDEYLAWCREHGIRSALT